MRRPACRTCVSGQARALAQVQHVQGWRRVSYAGWSPPASHQVTWEMLAQVAATLISDDGRTLQDAARQEEVILSRGL